MDVRVMLYEERHIPLVKAFNRRLMEKQEQYFIPESHVPSWLPKRPDSNLYLEYYVVGDANGVHGGYILKSQDFFLKGCQLTVYNLQSPISEGIIDPRYNNIGVIIARDILRKAPVMYSLGMGGYSEPIAKYFKAMRWKLSSVPFYFKVVNCNNFLRKNAILRKTFPSRMVLDFGAYSGLGPLSVHTVQLLRQRSQGGDHLYVEEICERDREIDKIWESSKGSYRLIAVRDSSTIDRLYPVAEKRFRRTKVYSEGKCIGWAVTLCTQMTSHKQFGSLRVGSIIDCLGRPEDAEKIIRVAASDLEERGADLIVANHSHHVWGQAFGRNGFLPGPSNFIFGASVALARQLEPFDRTCREIFFMRGDGDGPINL